jgi:hypothetical protein
MGLRFGLRRNSLKYVGKMLNKVFEKSNDMLLGYVSGALDAAVGTGTRQATSWETILL